MNKLTMFSPLLAFTLLACGGDEEKPGVTHPSEAGLRAYYGLTAGSCYLYRYQVNGVDHTLQDWIVGPVDVGGKKAYQRRRQYRTGGTYSEYFFYQADDAGKLRVLETRLGTPSVDRNTYRYDPAEAPAMLGRQIDSAGKPGFSGPRVQTVVTPTVCPDGEGATCAAGETEDHLWVSMGQDKVTLPDQSAVDAELLRYDFKRGSVSRSEEYWLVPNYGFAKIRVGKVVYTLCDARVCDAEDPKDCSGAANCDNLKCM